MKPSLVITNGQAVNRFRRGTLTIATIAIALLLCVTISGAINVGRPPTLIDGDMEIGGSLKVGGELLMLPIGTVVMFAGELPPDGWLLCNGDALEPDKNSDHGRLANLLKTKFDPSRTVVRLPDLRCRFALGAGAVGPVLTERAIGNMGGEEGHTLTIEEMPKHDHGFSDPGHGHNITLSAVNDKNNALRFTGFNNGPGLRDNNDGAAHQALHAKTNIKFDAQGGGKVHNIMPPFTVVNYIIKYK